MHLSATLLIAFSLQAAQDPPEVAVPRVEAEMRVDGVLDEAVWATAAKLSGFHQLEPADGRPAEERTEVLVWYSADAIHFGIRAFDSQADRIRATQADRDNIGNEDQVVLYLDTFDDHRRAFFFGVNPLGVQSDGVRTEGAASAGRSFGGNMDDSPDFLFDSRGRVTDEGYIVEVRIPFKSLRYPATDVQRWGFQVERRTQRTGYLDTWTDVRRAGSSFLLQAGTLTGLHDLERGIVFEAQPFVTINAPGARDAATGTFTRADPDAEVGANFRVGFTSISLDATINPDFSQVETDEGQVTVNERFALFFPEKRPFFLEGIELFNTPGQLVYTRRIANPIVGGKVTGKLGPVGLAHLTAIDENVDGTGDEALFNITRLRQDLGPSSSAGVTFTDRSRLRSSNYNRVLSGDVRVVFARLYYMEAQLANSWTRAPQSPDGAAALWKLEFDRTGRSWGFNYSVNGTGEGFRSESGFVNRTGIVDAHAFNRFTWYGKAGALIETMNVHVNPQRIWDYSGFRVNGAAEGNDQLSGILTLRGGWSGQVQLERTFFHPDPADYEGIDVATSSGSTSFIPAGNIPGRAISIEIETPIFRRFDASLEVGTGTGVIFEEAAQGDGFEAGIDVSLRPTQQLRLTASTVYARINRSRDDSEFARSIIPRFKAEYQATRHLFFRGIAEYQTEQKAALQHAVTGAPLLFNGVPIPGGEENGLRIDALVSYEPSPGTVAYLGYGSSYAERSPLERRLQRTDDGFFVKLAYQFRR